MLTMPHGALLKFGKTFQENPKNFNPESGLVRTKTTSLLPGSTRYTVLFQPPSGEFTELYDEDWRTTPLVESPMMTLWPGELTRQPA